MVHHVPIRRTNLDRLNEPLFSNLWIEPETEHRHDPARRQCKPRRELEDLVGGPPHVRVPALRAKRRRNGCCTFAFRRAAIYPADRSGDLRVGENALIAESAVLPIGVPRRHLTCLDDASDCRCSAPCVLVRKERHWRVFAGPVTTRTVRVENRRHIGIERGVNGSLGNSRRGPRVRFPLARGQRHQRQSCEDWERTLGFSLEELQSRPMFEFVHHEDRQRTLDQNLQVRSGGQALGFENRYL